MKTRKTIRAVFALVLAAVLACGSLPTATAVYTTGEVVTLADGGTYPVIEFRHEGDFDVYYLNGEGTGKTIEPTDSTYGVSIRRIREDYLGNSAACLYIPDTYRGYPVVRLEKADSRNHYLGVRIPASLTEIVDPKFSNCPYLEWIEVDNENPYCYSVDGVLYKGNQNTDLTHLVCYPQGKKDESFTTYPGAQYIDDGAFNGNASLKTLTIAAGQKGVAVGAIRSCSALETLIFGEGTISRNYFLVSNCPALQTVHFSDSYLLAEPMPVLDSIGVNGLTVCSAAYSQTLETAAQIAGCACCVCGSEHACPQQDVGTPDQPLPGDETISDASRFRLDPCYQRDAQGTIVKDANGMPVQIGYAVLGLKESCSRPAHVTIPASFGNLPIIEIASGFSTSFDELLSVHIPSTVRNIAPGAFAYGTTLEEITVDADSAFFKAVDNVLYTADGKELVSYPVGKKDAVYTIPEGTERVSDGTLGWSSSLREIRVPATFRDGRLADTLDTAKNLEAVVVDAANPVLMSDGSGVLYNKDRTALLFYPPYGPADYTLPQSVTMIADRSIGGRTLRTLRIADGVTATPIADLSGCVYMITGSICLHIPASVTTVRFNGARSCFKICCTTRASQAAAYAAANGITFLICNADHSELRLPTDDDPPTPQVPGDDVYDFYYIFETDADGISQITGVGIRGLTQTPYDTFVLTIPAQYRGLPVREVDFSSAWAKANGDKVTRLVLPQTVETLEGMSDSSTDYFPELMQITVHTANPYLRSAGGVLFDKAMTTLILYPAGKTDASYAIPDGVVTVANGCSLRNQYLQHLTIPASFTGTTSYSLCFNALRMLRKLQSFTVDPENPVFAGDEAGALLSADEKTLILYPRAAPSAIYTIPASVNEIHSSYTFYQPEHLQVICIAEGATSTPYGDIGTTVPYLHIPSGVRNVYLRGVSPTYQTICSDAVDSAAAVFAKSHDVPFALCNADHTQITRVQPEDIPYHPFNFSYITEKDSAGVTHYTGVYIKELRDMPDEPFTLTIPETYYGLPVRKIDLRDWSNTRVERIELPKTLQEIVGTNANVYSTCTDLRSITADEANAYFCAVDGVLFDKDMTSLIWYPAAKPDVAYAIPAGVQGVYNRGSFSENRYLQHLLIPASFTGFGSAANTCFSSLRELRRITVDEQNPELSSDENGVLYNRNKVVLFLYPCANEAETLHVPASVLRIGWAGQKIAPQHLRVLCIEDGVKVMPDLSDDWGSVQVVHIPSSVETIHDDVGSKLSPSVTICCDSADSAAAQFARDRGFAFEVCGGHSAGTTPDEPPVGPTEPIALSVSGGTARPGDIVRVTVDLTKNAGVVALRMHLSYDPSVLTLTGVQDGGLLETASFVTGRDLAAVPYTVLWEDALTHTNHTATGTLVTYTFRVSEDAEAGATPVTVTYDEHSTYNVDLQNVACAITNGAVTVSIRKAGDANGDGVLDLKDVVLMRRFLAGGWDVMIETKNMDVDGDGTLSLKDSTLLSRFLAGGWNVTLK